MLTEMAKMSQDDGMVMQIHPDPTETILRVFRRFGADKDLIFRAELIT